MSVCGLFYVLRGGIFVLKNKRQTNIDLIESIAIFFVLVYHSTLYFFDFLSDNSFMNYVSYFSRTILSTCVPLFFFANGYLLFNRPFDLKKHIYKMLKIIALIFIWALLLMHIYILISGEQYSIRTVIFSILNQDTAWAMNIFWYLCALISIYVLFPALKALFDSNKKAFIFFTVACAILTFGFVFVNQISAFLGVLLHHRISIVDKLMIQMFNPFRGAFGYSFVYFCVGGLICTYEDKIRLISKRKRNIVSCIGILVSCLLLFLVGVFYSKFINNDVWDVVWNGYDSIFTFFNVIFIYVLSLNYTKDYRFIRSISCNTLGIYFTHEIVVRSTISWMKSFDFLCNIPVNLIYAFAIMCVCLGLCLVIRKIPLLKKLL